MGMDKEDFAFFRDLVIAAVAIFGVVAVGTYFLLKDGPVPFQTKVPGAPFPYGPKMPHSDEPAAQSTEAVSAGPTESDIERAAYGSLSVSGVDRNARHAEQVLLEEDPDGRRPYLVRDFPKAAEIVLKQSLDDTQKLLRETDAYLAEGRYFLHRLDASREKVDALMSEIRLASRRIESSIGSPLRVEIEPIKLDLKPIQIEPVRLTWTWGFRVSENPYVEFLKAQTDIIARHTLNMKWMNARNERYVRDYSDYGK